MIARRKVAELEVPIAPMLDLSFNLLTFFIFTFNPMPVELQFNMNLLPAQPVARPDTAPPPPDQSPSDEPPPLRTITTRVYADGAGRIARIELDEIEVDDLPALKAQLEPILKDPDLKFDQALIQVDPNLHYAELIRVINLYSELNLTKIAFNELD
jgi:biopolymer transport protein ExbD